MELSDEDVESLAAKLAAAELTDNEWAIVAALVAAAEHEVTGYSRALKVGFGALLPPAKHIVAQSGSGEIFRTDGPKPEGRPGRGDWGREAIVAQSGDGEI